MSASAIRGIPLTDVTGDRGVLLAINVAMAERNSYLAINTLTTIAAPLASKLSSLERMQPNALENFLRGITSGIRGAKRQVVLTISILVGIVLLLPIRYTVKAKVEIQPIQHRYVAVPFDGPLEVAHVRPGDIVQEGQLLARLNPREVDYELASLRAELNQSLQEQKRLVATHDFAGSKIAALESERLDLQTKLLQFHHDNLEIRSPIAGVVVSGDWKQSEGMPMSRGATLFEIAPLGRMVVEIAVPESDIAHVREGLPAKFYVESLPNRTMASVIGRVHPRAELKDHENVFIAEIVIDDPENLLRPGMRGRARISSDRHPLGWNLFHQAYFTLCKLVRW
jgi:multidrug efflux pump subunit AcrA (membrane-fusion protein)